MKKIYFLVLTFIAVNSFGQVGVSINSVASICNPGDCVNATANYTEVKETTSYNVVSVPYNPIVGFTGGTILNNTSDDIWSSVLDLPFAFCFYGQNYNKILVGSNGVITFDIQGLVPGGTQVPGGACPWSFSTTIPNATFPIRNAIYGAYQDTDIRNPPVTNPAMQNVNYYVFGTAPNRLFVINFNELPHYQCNGSVGLQSSQIVLHETTNIIDIRIKNRTSCATWNAGKGLVGMQNQAGTIANVPPGRNTGTWSASNEEWSFIPNGNSATTFFWNFDGVYLGNTNPITICPNDNGVLQAVVQYTSCNGSITPISNDVILNLEFQPINPNNLTVCASGTDPGIFDLTQNNSVMLNGENPVEYDIKYYTSLVDATNLTNPIVSPQSFLSMGQTIYASIEGLNTGCLNTKSFDLIRNQTPQAPTGDIMQSFFQGQTLDDIEVTGNNIIWYSTEFGQTILPNTTPLVDATTYYAAQSDSGCVSGKSALSNPGRLGVTVYNVLNMNSFDVNSFKAYPNPVKDVLNLSYTKEISSVSVFNLLGQEMMTKSIKSNQSKIDLSNLPSGTYLVKVASDNVVKTIKVVKE